MLRETETLQIEGKQQTEQQSAVTCFVHGLAASHSRYSFSLLGFSSCIHDPALGTSAVLLAQSLLGRCLLVASHGLKWAFISSFFV